MVHHPGGAHVDVALCKYLDHRQRTGTCFQETPLICQHKCLWFRMMMITLEILLLLLVLLLGIHHVSISRGFCYLLRHWRIFFFFYFFFSSGVYLCHSFCGNGSDDEMRWEEHDDALRSVVASSLQKNKLYLLLSISVTSKCYPHHTHIKFTPALAGSMADFWHVVTHTSPSQL